MNASVLINYIPAILMLGCFMIMALVILKKFGNRIFSLTYTADTTLIIITAALFVIILITHLFKEQSWTADTLKIIIGVLVGVGAGKASKKSAIDFSAKDVKDSIVNNALGDINQKIDNFQSQISSIENAVLNQYPTIENKLSNIEGARTVPKITKREHEKFQVTDPSFLQKLKDATHEKNDWTWKWMMMCLTHAPIRRQLDEKIKFLKEEGWENIKLGLDNTENGIHVNFDLERELQTIPD